MEQSARDCGCEPADFEKSENVIVPFRGLSSDAKIYYREPIACNFVSYGSNLVASVREDCRAIVNDYLSLFEFYHCFETPNLHWLDERLALLGERICFMAEYFLPDPDRLRELPCPFPTRILYRDDFEDLYLPEWNNALCEARKEADILGIGAYDGDRLIALAACSTDCAEMWQIGIDVLPEYRRRGIASALTARLALEILKRGKVPFYCAAWSNIRSVRNAIRSGFCPAWVEMTVKPQKTVYEINWES